MLNELMKKLLGLQAPQLPEPPLAPKANLPLIDGRPKWLEALQPVLGEMPIPSGPPVKIDDPTGKLAGNFDRSVFMDVISKAKMAGVDPLTALAMAGQETTFGRYGAGADNPLHLLHRNGGIGLPHGDESHPGGDTLAALDYFKKRSKPFMHDEELAIQSYNGLGKIQGGSEIPAGEKMYGGRTELHGGRDRPYGKEIIRLRQFLSQQPAIKGLLEQ
jgi:hypothetical protein